MKVAPVSPRWGAALILASLGAAFAAPSAQAAAPVERSQAIKKALSALEAEKGDDALTVFALRSTVPAGTEVTQAGPETVVSAARTAGVPSVSARLARAGVKAFGADQVVRTMERSWLLYADEGPSQAYEHPGRVVVVGAASGKVTVSEKLRWVPLFDGRLPVFFRTAADHDGKTYRVFDRPWKQRTAEPAKPPTARAAQAPPATSDAQKRLADALANERSCALRVSDTLGDFYDFARVDKSRAALGRVFTRLAKLNGGFATERYVPRTGRTPIEAAQRLISRGCADLLLYVAGSGAKSGSAGIVVGLRAAGGTGIQWHTISGKELETLVQSNREVTFKLVLDAPYAGRVAEQLKDEKNVSVLLTPGGVDDPSFTYLPHILGGQGVVSNTTNPTGLLEFTNELIVGLERFAATPEEIDHAIAERAAGRSDSVLAWMLARALDLAPSPFTEKLLGTTGQRVPVTSSAASRVRPPINHAPLTLTPPQLTREDVTEPVTLIAIDPDLDPLAFQVTVPPTHGTFSGTAPFLTYTPDRDFHGFDSFTYRVSDGRGGVSDQTVVITVLSDNDAPAVVSGPSGTPAQFTENGSAVVVDNALTVTDADSSQLVGAKVQIVAGRAAGDVLAATPPAGITASYDALSGVLTLTGNASRASYQSALRSVTFGSTSEDPGTARTIRFSVDDGDELGVPATRDVTVIPVNDAPVNTVPATQSGVEDTVLTLSGANKIAVADVDARTDAIEVTVSSAQNGKLHPATAAGLTVTGDNSATLKLTGPQAQINAALDGLTYTPATDATATDTLTVLTSDLGRNGTGGPKSDTDGFTVTLAAGNDAPVNTVPGPQTTAEGTAKAITGFAVADVDAGSGTITATLTSVHGDFAVTGGSGAAVTSASGSTEVEGTLTQVNAALATVTYTPHGDYFGADTITLTTDDEGNTPAPAKTDTDTVSVTVTGVNDAPVLTAPVSVTTAEDTAYTFAPGALAVADVDAGSGDVQVTVTARLSGGMLPLGRLSAGVVLPGLVVAGEDTPDLTLTGTLAEVNDALAGLVYTPVPNFNGTIEIGVEVDDLGNTGTGGALTDDATVGLTVTQVNDAPVLAPPTGDVAFAEGGASATVAGDLTVADVDDSEIESARIAIAAGRQDGDDLDFADTPEIAGSYDSATGVLTLTGTATTAQYQAALRTIAFSTSEQDPTASRTIELTVNDGALDSAPATRTVTIAPVNDAPTLDTSPGSAAYTENGPAVDIDPGLTLADVDDASLEGATVVITANHDAADHLTFIAQNGIGVSSWTPATGTLVLHGTASKADYETALRSVAFRTDGDAPSPATRTVSFTVTDGDATSAADTRTVTVDDVNDAPVNTVPGAQSMTEDTSLTFDGARQISVADVDAAAGDALEVTVTVSGGTFDLSGTTGLTFAVGDGDDDATATFTGTQANLNAALDGLVYTPTPGTSGSRQLQITTDDEGHTGGPAETDTDTVAITVNALNRAPVNQLPSPQTVDEDTDLVFSSGNGNPISIADVDAGSGIIETAIGVTNGTLTLSQTTGLTFLTTGANGTSFVHVEGTLADINAALAGAKYTPAPDWSGSAQLSMATEDRGNTGVGGNETDSDTLGITVSAVNDGPTASAPAAESVAEEGELTFAAAGANALTVADVDAGAAGVTVDVTVTHGTVTLGSTAGVVVGGDGTAHVTLSGETFAVNAALEGTVYEPAADYAGAASLTLDVADNGNTGSGGAKTASDTTAITVTAVNDAPVLTAPATTTANQSASRTFTAGTATEISIADVDAGTGEIEVELGVAHGTLTLAQTTGLTFGTGDGDEDAAVRFTGTLANVNDALDGLVYEPTAGYHGPDTLDVDVDDQGNTGAGAPGTASKDVAITVLETNTAPVNTVPGAQTLDEDTTRTFAGADKLAVTDANVDAATGELEVDLDVDHGTLTLDGTTGLTITGGANGSAAVSVKGSPNALNAALDGLTYTPTLHYAGDDTLTLVTDDLGAAGPPGPLTDTDTVALTITAQNDAPVLTVPASITAAEDGTQAIAGVSLADADAGGNDIRLRLAVTNGTLTLGTTTGLSFTTGNGADDAEIVAEGTVGELNAALATLSYEASADYAGADTLDLDVSDLGHTGAGGTLTDAEDVPVTVTAVNDAPVNALPSAPTIDEDTTLTLSGGAAIAVFDVDAASLTVTLSTAGGTLTLSGTTGLAFTTGDGTANTTMTFSGTKAAINAALDGLVFTPTPNSNGATSISVTTSDGGATGSGGPQTDTDALSVTVTPVNDAPELTQPDTAVLTYTEDTPSENHEIAIAPNLTVTDVDSANLSSATVRIGTPATGDDLTFTTQNGITGSYDAPTGTLTLSGAASVANYQTALRTVKYRTTSENPETTQRTITFRVNDGQPANNLSNQVTRQIDVVRTNDAPTADDETFSGADRVIGNTTLFSDDPSDVATAPTTVHKKIAGDLLTGDTDPDTALGQLTVTPVTNAATTGGGKITIEADGDFTYQPAQGCSTTPDTYAYTVNDNDALGNRTDTGTLTFNSADCVWYVDADVPSQPAAATGGTSEQPFKTLAELDGAGGSGDEDNANDKLFLYDGSYAGGLPLESGQQVLTQRHGLIVPDGGAGNVTLVPAGGGNTTISDGVVAATNNTLQGVVFGTASSGFALSGTNVGTLTVNTATSGGLSNPSGGGVSIGGSGNALDVQLSSFTTNGGANAISLTGASGTFTAGAGTVSNASGATVALSGGTVNFTLAADIRDDAGQTVSISGQSGGTKEFNGEVSDLPGTTANNGGGVSLSGNTGATIRFNGGVNLSTGAINAFSATGGGTVTVADPPAVNNTLTTVTGTPLTVTNTTIGAGELTFERISSNGAPNGIVLTSTGAAGGLNVTGAGGTCTNASPTTCTGGQILSSTGAGIAATNVAGGGGLSLSHLRVHDGDDDGIRATTVGGVQIASSVITNNGDALTERGLDYDNVTGHSTLTNSHVSSSYQDNVRFDNDSGTAELDITNSAIASSGVGGTSAGGDGVQVYGDGSADIKADVTGTTFTGNIDDAFQLLTTGAATSASDIDLNFNQNTLSANAGQVEAGALLTVNPSGDANVRALIDDNDLTTSKGRSLIASPGGTTSFDATITNNTVLNSGGEGIVSRASQGASARVRIANNIVQGWRSDGMYIRHGEGTGRADFIVQGNTINNGQAGAFFGLKVEAGATDADTVTVCADIGSPSNAALKNTIQAGSGDPDSDIMFAQYLASHLLFPQYAPPEETYLMNRNLGMSGVLEDLGAAENTSACQTPTLPPAA